MNTLVDSLLQREPQPASYYKKKKYHFGRVLGSGTYGEVKEGVVIATKQKVAIKIIQKSILRGYLELVQREIKVVESLDHPNIIKLIDWFESRYRYYIIFELATGGELFDKICQLQKFNEIDAIKVIKTVLEAVKYLHSHNVIHRDLKPENLLYKDKSLNAPIMIADFGIAKAISNSDEVLNTLCGSYGYTAPEILLRTGYGMQVDMWSIGVITYILLSGYTPFAEYEHSQHEMITAVTNGNFEFHQQYWQLVSGNAKNFISGLLNPNPDSRLSIDAALSHPWLNDRHVNDVDLLSIVKSNFNPRLALRKAVDLVRAANRFKLTPKNNQSPSIIDADSDDDNNLDEK